MKQCSKCRVNKNLDEFYKQTKSKDGLNSHCKNCCSYISKEVRKKVAEKYKTYKKHRNNLGYRLTSTMKEIPNFPKYFITKNGRIWSNKKCKDGIFLTSSRSNKGYKTVILYNKNGERKPCRVHRLVLESFVGKCPNGMESCHNNGNKLDNRLGNLRWDTKSNNAKDAIRHGTHNFLTQRGENHNQAKLTEHDVRTIIYLWRANLFTKQEVAKIYNITPQNVSSIVLGKTWKHIWIEE